MGKKIRVWDGTAWQDVSPSLPYTAIHSAQASMPLTGVDGQVWLDTDGTLAGQDFVPLSGGTMTGNLNTPSINSGGISGKNYVINGGFDIWQRGTSFTQESGFGPDRFHLWGHGTNLSIARSTDTPNANSKYSLQIGMSSYNSSDYLTRQSIERPTGLYGQLTISFWAKTSSGTVLLNADVTDISTPNFTVTNTWQKFSATIGTSSTNWDSNYPVNNHTFLDISIASASLPYTGTIFISQIKLEMGTQATQFCTAGANIQQELAMCQRYYWRVYNSYSGINNALPFTGVISATNQAWVQLNHPVKMRTTPTGLDYANIGFYVFRTGGNYASGTWTLNTSSPDASGLLYTTSSGLTVNDAGITNQTVNGTNVSYFGLSAEL